MKKETIIIIILIVLILGGGIYYFINKSNKAKEDVVVQTDAERFASEYSKVGTDNVFVYKSIDDIIDILEHGTGVVYLGFSSCPWCQQYAVYLNETAKNAGLDKIYYYDIKEDRANNTDKYQELLTILKGSLQYDDEGQPRIYVPDVTVVKEGKILGRDFETSKDTGGFDNPTDYWTDKKVKALENKLSKLFNQVIDTTCTDCNKE
jgi:hypothetical protein